MQCSSSNVLSPQGSEEPTFGIQPLRWLYGRRWLPIGDVPQDTTLINYATDGTIAGDAANNRCYPIEFKQVDERWQLENPGATN